MPQNRRKPKESGLDRITLMLPAELKAQLESEVEPGVRTFSDVARENLRRGLQVDTLDDRLSPWARAIGRLVGLSAQDLIELESPTRAATMLKVAASKLLDGIGAEAIETLDQSDRELAEAFALTLIQKVLRAHLPDKPTSDAAKDRLLRDADRAAEMEQPSLRSKSEFLAYQEALGLSRAS